MTELLSRLEAEVDALPCYVSTSHTGVISRSRDVAVYGEGQADTFLFNVGYSYGVPDGSCWNIPAFVIEDFKENRYQLATVDEAMRAIILNLQEAGIVNMGEEGESGAR